MVNKPPTEIEIKNALTGFELEFRANLQRLQRSGAIPVDLYSGTLLKMTLAYTGEQFHPLAPDHKDIYRKLRHF